ncbi:selenium-dependent molybdenum cofactor biosynthesis protein YqeB [Desulfitobacterium sp. AusDCA]|uniref:selenium-dependent molybdenum cofactor biosynthesis protein YqeB n=1 Tax=Desulfitobacterium sp. AusDCA TaxID=3240383 RepID=UPI003DA6ECF2
MNRLRQLTGPMVLIRGAGEQASGVAWALVKAGFRVIMTEVEQPLMVRWPVSYGTAAAAEERRWTVEGITAYHVTSADQFEDKWAAGGIPILVDPELTCLKKFQPVILVDAIMAKRNLGTCRDMAPLTIGLGPGFTAGKDVHVVIETNRGHNLGRIILEGTAEPNTGVPGDVAGYSWERVVYSSQAGTFRAARKIGERVARGDVLGIIEGEQRQDSVLSPLGGIVRGLIQTGTYVASHIKIGDIDPREEKEYCWTISDKARAIGAAVLLSILEQEALRLV